MNHQSDKLQSPPRCNSSGQITPQAAAVGIRGRVSRTTGVAAGAALCLSFVSCVGPYDGYGGGHSAYTTYQTGHRLSALPGGYRTEMIGGRTYYYNDGNYYNRDSGGYVVTDAPRQSRYYEEYGSIRRGRQVGTRQHQDTYSRSNQRNPQTEYIRRLPDGHRAVTHDGQQYYEAGDRIYVRERDQYRIVTRPY